jgi:glucokinase
VAMTNQRWSFSIQALKAELGLRRLLVINDFSALALALPCLPRQVLRQVGGGTALAGGSIGLIGPGTGLGVSGLLPNGLGGWVPVQGEGGHATLAATTVRERAVLQGLARRHGHVSAERAVSGPGLVDIHAALVELDARAAASPALTAAQITERALGGEDASCVEALTLFCGFLGIAAGNLALTLGAKGGVYIGGGIVPRLGRWFDASPFRDRFESKGRFKAYLADIPVFVIETEESPAFLGAAQALDASAPLAGRMA